MKNIGIDIGGTSIKGAVIENGTVTARAKRSTNISRGLDSIRDCLFAVIKDLLPLAGAGAGIGIGSAGDIDPYEGKVLYATGNLPGFTGFEIKKDAENKFNRRVFVVNDAAAAFIGEAYFGAAENCKNAVMLTLGTGLGSAASINGKLLTGANFHAARIGHIPLHIGGPNSMFRQPGLCERQTSLTAAASTATEFSKKPQTATKNAARQSKFLYPTCARSLTR
mgnify:CR=1 FL=1